MAEINVERKGASIWPWILGLLVLLLLGWAIVELLDSDEPEIAAVDPVAAPVAASIVTPAPAVPATPAAPGVTAMPAAVSTYLTQCTEEQGAPQGEMGLQHQFTVNCLQQLRAGLDALITQGQVANTNVSQRSDQYTSTVQSLQASNATNTNHANMTRDAAGIAVQVMQAMQTAWFAGNQQIQSAVNEVQQAAQGIQTTVPMLQQRESVHTFFRGAGDALLLMAENRTAAAPA